MKTKSTGKRARLGRRRTILRSEQDSPPTKLPSSDEAPSISPTLQVRPEPKPPTPGEQRILDLLWSEFAKSDDVARASARFESEVHEQLVQRRLSEGYSADEAGDIRRVFRADDFNDTFRRLLQLRIDVRLIQKLGLQNYEREIIATRIREVFAPKPTGTRPVVVPQPSDHLQVGSEDSQQIRDLKSRAHSGRWTKTQK